MVKKGVVDSSFLTFLAEKVEDDRQSIASWGTGGTTYTEIIKYKDMSETDTSSITQDTPKAAVEEINRRKALVRARLIEKNVTHQEIDDIPTSWPLAEFIWPHGTRIKKYFWSWQ